jgi:O-methyltransferase
MFFKKRLASALWPRYSHIVDMINHNPEMMEWIRKHSDIPVFQTRSDYFNFVNDTVLQERQIDYLEFGVFRGASMLWWSDANRHPQSRFWGFDSFQGLPEEMHWAIGGTPVGHLSVHGKVPAINDHRVQMVKGLFQDTLDEFLDTYRPAGTLVLHLDADIYSATLYVLAKLDRLIACGAVLMFDEFPSALQEFRAFRDYVSSHRRAYKPLATCVHRYAIAMGSSHDVIESFLRAAPKESLAGPAAS